jgi:hypothetical protein
MRVRITKVLGALAGVALLASPAFAQATKGKSVQTEAEWVAYDAAASTVKVKVKKNRGGKAPEGLALKEGQEATFKVKAEGSVLTKTTVAINSQKAELGDLKAGKTVMIYWVADTADPKARFARKIDQILSDEEADERYGTEDVPSGGGEADSGDE